MLGVKMKHLHWFRQEVLPRATAGIITTLISGIIIIIANIIFGSLATTAITIAVLVIVVSYYVAFKRSDEPERPFLHPKLMGEDRPWRFPKYRPWALTSLVITPLSLLCLLGYLGVTGILLEPPPESATETTLPTKSSTAQTEFPSQESTQDLTTMTSAPSQIPWPTDTPVPAAISLELMLKNCPSVSEKLGIRKTHKPGIDQFVAYQEFTGNPTSKGVMIYRSSAERSTAIIVLFPDGTWSTYPDLWQEGMPLATATYSPPDGFYVPVHGFELAWLEIQESEATNRRLNWASTCEIAADSVVWGFNEGKLFQLTHFIHFTTYPSAGCDPEDITSHIGQTYVLYYSPGSEEDTGVWEDITYCKNQ